MVCAAQAFYNTLTTSQQATVQYAWTNQTAKTLWSNLPVGGNRVRAGVQTTSLSSTSKAAMLTLAQAALSDQGYADFFGVIAADQYLNQLGANGYGSDYYFVAFVGTPSTTGSWMLMLGGHHMAFNIAFVNGVAYPVPHHIAVEPKATFTVNSGDYAGTYTVLASKATAMVNVFNNLSSTQLSSAYMSGSFSDIVLGAVEYGTGSYTNVSFPTGSNRRGVLVSSLSSAQQALVTAAIEQYVRDYEPAAADALVSAYTSSSAYADTYIGWGGTQASGVNVNTNGTYMRIDGPRLWLEIACQNGVVVNATHYHMMYRDKSFDYGTQLL